ncbi:MAG: AAA family ATPase [Lachnospiraceae bacterium]|nr:AAA family ATPase [Lachnospiraceae bacterium]
MKDKSNLRIDEIIDSVYSDFFGDDVLTKMTKKSDKEKMNALLDEKLTSIKTGKADTPQAEKNAGDKKADDKKADDKKADDKDKEKEKAEESVPPTDAPQAAAGSTPDKGEKKEPEKSAMEELDELIGLGTIKEDVKELISLVKMQKMREAKGMKTVPVSLHLVFSGNPGTGKTTVARILARLYKEIGVLSKGQLVEVDRSGLVAGFVGQTAIKTQDKIKEAMGGILFIDEAYTLNKEGGQGDFGQEAIDTILKAMEDNRKDLVVIVAGYTDLMKKFVESNPGLKSRFNKYMEFPDYTADELIQIWEMNCRKYNYTFSLEAKEMIEDIIKKREASKGENFANARDIRNMFETIITNHATRVSEMEDPSDNDLTTIMTMDIRDV